jgi:hypothetical protein
MDTDGGGCTVCRCIIIKTKVYTVISHQFHKYQQNEQSNDVENTDHGMGHTHKCGELNQLMGSQPSSLDYNVPS